MAIASFGVALYGASENRKARKDQKSAQRAQRELRDIQSVREKRNQIREARIRRAQILAQAEATGTTGASSQIGAVGSIQSQVGSNLGFLDTTNRLANRSSIFAQKAEDHLSKVRTANAAYNVGSNLRKN